MHGYTYTTLISIQIEPKEISIFSDINDVQWVKCAESLVLKIRNHKIMVPGYSQGYSFK